MPLFFRFLVIFLIAGIPFHIFSPLNAKESLSFYCPHQCGQFGSKDIQNVEWKFVELLYQADKIQSFLSQNSKPYDPKILKDFFEFVFSYPKPKDFQSNWYQAMIRYISKNDWMRLNISDLDTYQRDCCDEYDSYNGSHCYIWGIRSIENEKNAHVGKVFIKHECNHIEESYDEDGDLESYGSEKGGGMRYRLEFISKNGEKAVKAEVRIMPGNPHSPNPMQQKPYVKHSVNGKFLDKEGLLLLENQAQARAHIPLSEYDFIKLNQLFLYD